MRYVGMLLTLVIICVLAVIIFRSSGLLTPSNEHDADWYYQHPSERTAKLQWCQQNPQQQNEGECMAATTAQTRADADAVHPGQ